MRKRIWPWVPVVLAAAFLRAQEPPEKVRVLCDKADPRHRCVPAGPECNCIPDTLEIVFDGQHDSTLFLNDFAKGQKITATVFLDVKSPDTPDVADIQGWSYGVLHDTSVLTILNATIEGTDLETIIDPALREIAGGVSDGVVTCETNDAKCPNPTPGGGFISGVVLSLRKPIEMPPGKRSSIARAHYETTGREVTDTLLQFTDRLAAKGSPPVAMNITVAGNSRLPEEVIEGWILKEFDAVRFHRGDADGSRKLDLLDAVLLIRVRAGSLPARRGCEDAEDANDDGVLTLADAIHVLNHLFAGGPPLPAPGPECGPDATGDALGCLPGPCGG